MDALTEDKAIVLAAKPLARDALMATVLTQHFGLVVGVCGNALKGRAAAYHVVGQMHAGRHLHMAIQNTPAIQGTLCRLQALKPLRQPFTACDVDDGQVLGWFRTLIDHLPQRHPYPLLYKGLLHLMAAKGSTDWLWTEVWFGCLLLRQVGYGLSRAKPETLSFRALHVLNIPFDEAKALMQGPEGVSSEELTKALFQVRHLLHKRARAAAL